MPLASTGVGSSEEVDPDFVGELVPLASVGDVSTGTVISTVPPGAIDAIAQVAEELVAASSLKPVVGAAVAVPGV